MPHIITLFIIFGSLAVIPLICKIQGLHTEPQDKWTDWHYSIFSIDGDSIYIAAPTNRKAKRAHLVTKDNCNAVLSCDGNDIIYDVRDIKYIIPKQNIDKVITGKDYYPAIRLLEGDKERFIVIKIKIDDCIKMKIDNDTMLLASKEGYDNAVVMDMVLTDEDQTLLINTLLSWIQR